MDRIVPNVSTPPVPTTNEMFEVIDLILVSRNQKNTMPQAKPSASASDIYRSAAQQQKPASKPVSSDVMKSFTFTYSKENNVHLEYSDEFSEFYSEMQNIGLDSEMAYIVTSDHINDLSRKSQKL